MSVFLVGIDGYDSPYAGCTTHFTVFLLEKLFSTQKFFLEEPPRLVRLNPNVPWRTRGNAAISFRVKTDSVGFSLSGFGEIVREAAEKYSWAVGSSKGTIILIEDPSDDIEEVAIKIYRKAVRDVVPRQTVYPLLEGKGLVMIGRESIVGSLAAIGYLLERGEYTYELLVYRKPGTIGKRKVDNNTVRKAEEELPTLFNNYDYRSGKNIASPSGPDPVLIGLRGLHAPDLLRALDVIGFQEPVYSYCLYKTNQHTDPHGNYSRIGELRLYQTGIIEGVVSEKPEVLPGGHTILKVCGDTGCLTVMFYAETRPLNIIASQLAIADHIRVLGSLMPCESRDGRCFNAEKLWIEETAGIEKELNPRCPICGHRMTSAGRGKGYKCPKCGYRLRRGGAVKEKIVLKRVLSRGPFTPHNGRLRHLVRPAYLEGIRPTLSMPDNEKICLAKRAL